MNFRFLFLALVLALGCSDGTGGASGTGGTTGTGGDGGTGGAGGQMFSETPPLEIGGERPAPVVIPRDYDPTISHPLVIVLHGFGPYTGVIQSAFFGITDMVDPKDVVLVLPNGTLNEDGDRFWNGATACCDPNDAVDAVG